jgi:hypothetical protein
VASIAVAEPTAPPASALSGEALKQAFVDELRLKHKVFYGTAIAQALRVDVADGEITFVFTQKHRVLTAQVEQKRAALEAAASRLAGRPVRIRTVEVDEAPAGPPPKTAVDEAKERLTQRAMADSAVQALLDVLPVEIKDVEEIEN